MEGTVLHIPATTSQVCVLGIKDASLFAMQPGWGSVSFDPIFHLSRVLLSIPVCSYRKNLFVTNKAHFFICRVVSYIFVVVAELGKLFVIFCGAVSFSTNFFLLNNILTFSF